MTAKKYTALEKMQLIKEVKDCGSISLVAKKHKIPNSTVHNWVNRKSSKNVEKQDLSKEIKVLKKQLAAKDLKVKILEDLLKKTNLAWLGD